MMTLGLKKQAPFLEWTVGLDLHQAKLFLVANKYIATAQKYAQSVLCIFLA